MTNKQNERARREVIVLPELLPCNCGHEVSRVTRGPWAGISHYFAQVSCSHCGRCTEELPGQTGERARLAASKVWNFQREHELRRASLATGGSNNATNNEQTPTVRGSADLPGSR